MSFLGEIKRRKVFQVAAVYLVVAWLIMQVVDVVSGPLLLPDLFARIVIVVLAIGFPLAVLVSWAFDLTPEGVVKDQGATQSGGRRIEYALIGVLIIAVGWVLYRIELNPMTPQADSVVSEETYQDILPNSIAVLPFRSLSPDPTDAFYADGIHIELISSLHQIQNLTAIGRDSVMRFRDSQLTNAAIASQLRVGALLQGDVRYDGDRVRVYVELLDPSTDVPIWSQPYEGNLGELFEFQANIATRIAAALEAELLPAEREHLEIEPTDNPEAIQYYLRARTLLPNIGSNSVPEFYHQYLDEAIRLDPKFTLALAAKAGDYAFAMRRPELTIYGSSTLADRESMAWGYAQMALAIDPDLGLGHMAVGLLHRFSRSGAESISAFERAYQLSPNDVDILDDYSRVLSEVGRHEEAVEIARRTVELSPDWWGFGDVLWRAGNYDEAAEHFYRLAENSSNTAFFPIWIALVEVMRGNHSEVRDQLGLAESRQPDRSVGLRAYLHGRIGDTDDARRLFDSVQDWIVDEGDTTADMALALLGIGDEEAALQILDELAMNLTPYNSGSLENSIALNSYGDIVLEKPAFAEVRARRGFRSQE